MLMQTDVEGSENMNASGKITLMETVLLVEDKESMSQMLRETLESEGYKTVIAKDGPEGIRQIKEGHFDLVLSDLKLPKKDGIEVLKASKIESPLTGYHDDCLWNDRDRRNCDERRRL